MQFMTCTGCKAIVQVNATGICLGCQSRSGNIQEDAYEIASLKQKIAEKENALQVAETESMAVRQQASNSQRVGKRNKVKTAVVKSPKKKTKKE